MLYKKTNPFLFIIIIILHMYCITCIHKKIHNIGIDGYKNLKKFFLETVLIIYIKSVIPPYNMRIKNVGWYINADLKLKWRGTAAGSYTKNGGATACLLYPFLVYLPAFGLENTEYNVL